MSQIRKAFNKAANSYDSNAFLQQEIALRLDNKFDIIKVTHSTILDLGAGTGFLSEKLTTRFPKSHIICLDFAKQTLKNNKSTSKICADAMHLPLASNSVDIITSNLMMQWCDDLNQLFSECFRVLKKDGLLIFSTFGTDTLKELKKSWGVVDDKNHINNFENIFDIGDKILQNGFSNPVMETDTITLTYKNVMDLMHDLRAIGAQTVKNRTKTLTGKNKFKQMLKMYETYRVDEKLPASYEVIYGHAWK